ncbi:MAG: hypothetical protein INH37_05035, partial [Myxococcaceae bacterium]|nr:hypothetical protein [Myxococcaceae bacterium]
MPGRSRRLFAGAPLDAQLALEVAQVAARHADVVQQLAGHHLVRMLPDERRLEPWHEWLRAVVAGTLDADAVRGLHGRLASVLASHPDAGLEAIANHWLAAGQGDQAAEAMLLAAERSREKLAFARAATLYCRALELLPPDERRRAGVTLSMSHCLASAGQGKAAADAFLGLARAPDIDVGQRLELQRLAAEQLLVSGHVDEGVAALSGVLSELGMTLAKTPSGAMGALLVRRAHLAMRGLSFDERAAAQVDPRLLGRIDACWSVAVGLGMVDTIRGASFQTRQLLLALDAGEPWRVARALAAEAAFVATEGHPAEGRARALVASARSLCERVGDVRLRGVVTFCEGLTRFLVGDFREARARVAEAEGQLREAGLGVSWEAASARLFSIWSLFYLGEFSEVS